MAWLPLGEAVDRVLARLADQREEKGPGGVTPPGKCARAEGEDYPARFKTSDAVLARPTPTASRIRVAPEPRSARRPSGE
jgi:hypothetical protein